MLGIAEYVFGGTDKKRSRRKVVECLAASRLMGFTPRPEITG